MVPAAVRKLAALQDQAKIRKGQWSGAPARRLASAELWRLVHQHYQAGVTMAELGEVLGIKARTVTAQLRHHGYLGGPSPSMRLVRDAAAVSVAGHGEECGARLSRAAQRVRETRRRLGEVKAQLTADKEELRDAVIAEYCETRMSVTELSTKAGVSVRTVRKWLQWQPADPVRHNQ